MEETKEISALLKLFRHSHSLYRNIEKIARSTKAGSAKCRADVIQQWQCRHAQEDEYPAAIGTDASTCAAISSPIPMVGPSACNRSPEFVTAR